MFQTASTIANNCCTGKDNKTHDIVRVVLFANVILLAVVLILGVVGYLYGYFVGKPFDIKTMFDSVLTYSEGIVALMAGGGFSLLLKKTTEPDGTTVDVTSVNNNG